MSELEEKVTSKDKKVEPVAEEVPKEEIVEEDKENASDGEYTDPDLSEEEEEGDEEEEGVQAGITDENELAELQTEAELPLDELRKRYQGSDEEPVKTSGDEDVSTGNSVETDSCSTKKRQCEAEPGEEESIPKKAVKVADAKPGQAEA